MTKLANALNIVQSGIVSHDGLGDFLGCTLQAGQGINISNPNGQTGNPIITNTTIYINLGFFTPVIIGGTTKGTATYSIQSGQYTRIGNMIMVTGSLSWTGHTGTGNLYVGNLPLPMITLSNYDPECIIRTDSIPWPSGTGVLFGEFNSGDGTFPYIQIVEDRSNNTEQFVQMNSSGILHFTGQYLTQG